MTSDAKGLGNMSTLSKVESSALTLLGVLFLSVVIYTQRYSVLRGQNDFIQLYAGAKLSTNQMPYSIPLTVAIQRAELGGVMKGVYFSRLPFYAVVLRPLAAFPYRVAYTLYQVLSIAACVAAVWLLSRTVREMFYLSAWSFAIADSILNGQDTLFLFLFTTIFFVLVKEKKDLLAGLILGLCAIKPHLFVLMPIPMLIHKRLEIVGGALVSGVVLLMLCFIGGGATWINDYLHMLRNPELHPAQSQMPNLHGLLVIIGQSGFTVETICTILVIMSTVFVSFRCKNFVLAACVAIIGGLLISYHAYIPDTVLLLCIYAQCKEAAITALGRSMLLLSTLPFIYLVSLTTPSTLALQSAVIAAFIFTARDASLNVPDLKRLAP